MALLCVSTDPSTALRSGRDDKGESGYFSGLATWMDGSGAVTLRDATPTALLPAETRGVDDLHAARSR